MRVRQVGVTLLELMIVLVIAGIAFTAAFPSFQGMIARNRIATTGNDLLLAINLARSEAIRVGGGAYVVADDDPGLTVAGADNEFGEGWCVAIRLDDTADPTCGTPADFEVIRRFGALNTTDTMNSVEDVSWVEFDGMGALANTAAQPRQFDLCSDAVDGRRIFINVIGRSKSHGPDDLDATRRPDC